MMRQGDPVSALLLSPSAYKVLRTAIILPYTVRLPLNGPQVRYRRDWGSHSPLPSLR